MKHTIVIVAYGGVRVGVHCETCADVVTVIDKPDVTLDRLNDIEQAHSARPHMPVLHVVEPLGGRWPGVTGHLPDEEE